MRLVLWVCLALFLLPNSALAWWGWERQEPEEVVTHFIDAALKGDYKGAYKYTTSFEKSEPYPEEFEKAFEEALEKSPELKSMQLPLMEFIRLYLLNIKHKIEKVEYKADNKASVIVSFLFPDVDEQNVYEQKLEEMFNDFFREILEDKEFREKLLAAQILGVEDVLMEEIRCLTLWRTTGIFSKATTHSAHRINRFSTKWGRSSTG